MRPPTRRLGSARLCEATRPRIGPPDVAARVLSRISCPWQQRLAGWTIDVRGDRDGYRGATYPDERRIQMHVDPGTPIAEPVHGALHEIGHALDVTLLDEGDREAFNGARGRGPFSKWWVVGGCERRRQRRR